VGLTCGGKLAATTCTILKKEERLTSVGKTATLIFFAIHL